MCEAAESRGLKGTIVDLGNVPNPWTDPPEEQIAFWCATLTEALPWKRSGGPPATAVFCWNDRMAFGLYAALARRGLKVGDDVSVVGFDDDEAGLALPPLSTVSHEFHRMGAEATRLALRLLDGSLPVAEAQETVVCVPSRFVPRKSTGPALSA
jgi:DNA-binding LacI/PurR family transcriptional regulator